MSGVLEQLIAQNTQLITEIQALREQLSGRETAPPKAKKADSPVKLVKKEEPVEAETTTQYTEQHIREALGRLLASHGQEAAAGLMARYNAKNVSGLDVAVYDDFMAALAEEESK